MITLHELKNPTRPKKKIQRVGRGPGSNRGKTCCRGHKGEGSRSGYKHRYGYEGGQMPLYRKLPCRGFTRGRFKKPLAAIHFSLINTLFQDGEVVSPKTLEEKGFSMKAYPRGLKILATGTLEKKVSIEAHAFSKRAQEKLDSAKVSYKKLEE